MERPPGRKSLGWCKILWSTPPLILDSLVQRLPTVGTWLSLVEHSLGVRGVGSSNLPVPTNHLSCRPFRNLRAYPSFTFEPGTCTSVEKEVSEHFRAREILPSRVCTVATRDYA